MSYIISDEPQQSRFGHLVVRPSGILFAAMFCGTWLALPWFAFNGYAMGSPTRRKELALCALTLGVTVVLATIFVVLWDRDIIESSTGVRLFALVVTTWKLGMLYAIETVQSRTFGVYEYYGGRVRQTRAVLSIGYFVGSFLLSGITDPFWLIIIWGVY